MNKWLSYLSLLLVAALLLLVLVSWMLAATQTPGVRSLLSGEGVRWLLGSFSRMLLTPLLSWLLVGAMAWGAVRGSGLLQWRVASSYRDRLAARVSALLFAAFWVVVALLVALPHAVLLSVSGGLWPSPFSRALVPLAALAVLLSAVFYGVVTRRLPSVQSVFAALSSGVASAAPFLVCYVLAAQLVQSLLFVFARSLAIFSV